MAKDFYTTHQAAKFCSVYPTTVINWIKEGILAAYTTAGGHRRIKKDDLLKLMQKNNMPIPQELIKGGRNKVLVIDDDPKILKMINTVLSGEQDLEILTTDDGFQAGLTVSMWVPDIILLDMLMPGIDGFEVCRRLRADDKTKDIPIVAVTVLKDAEEIKKMRSRGITDVLCKPFKSEDLIKKVKEHLLIDRID